MIPNNSISNEERANFLRALDASDLVVSDWEAKFIESFLNAYRWWNWFTEGRQVATDKMWMKYGAMLALPYPKTEGSGKSMGQKIPEADENGCQFLVGNKPCNAPAVKQRRNGFRYCHEHAEQVQRDLKRRGKTMELIPVQTQMNTNKHRL